MTAEKGFQAEKTLELALHSPSLKPEQGWNGSPCIAISFRIVLLDLFVPVIKILIHNEPDTSTVEFDWICAEFKRQFRLSFVAPYFPSPFFLRPGMSVRHVSEDVMTVCF